jgi:ParB family chromosome partitioning protein
MGKATTDPQTALLTEVRPNPDQPRTYFKLAGLRSLARSIRQHGQRTPIEVKLLPADSTHKYEIIEGERRWRACAIGEISTIRITIAHGDISPVKQHMLSLIANLHREGHIHMDVSRAMKYQLDNGASVVAIAEGVDRSEPWVYQYLSLQKLIPELQGKMHPETPDHEMLRFGEALVLASVPTEKQDEGYKLMLGLPVKMRLGHVRQWAEEITGIKRQGRPRNVKREMSRFVNRLSADTEKVLEMKNAEFQQILLSTPHEEVQGFLKGLETARERLTELIQAIKREAETLRVAKLPPRLQVVK